MTTHTTGTSARVEELRRTFAQLRCLAGSTADADLKARLHEMSAKLLESTAPAGSISRPYAYPQHLTGREIDVLAVVGVGATNSEAAERLGVSTETVKGYLRTAMHKLQATNRYSAVQSARRHRFIGDLAALPTDVEVHVMPTGQAEPPKYNDLSALRYRGGLDLRASIARAYAASAAYLDERGL